MEFQKISPDAFPPTKGSIEAAGFDLSSIHDCIVKSRDKAIISTGLKIKLPSGCYGRIAPRSGLTTKHFIDVGGM